MIKKVKSAKELEEAYQDLSYQLGENRMEIYKFNSNNPTDYSLYSQEDWDQFDYDAEVHYNRLKDEGEIDKSLLPILGEVEIPMLLLLGKHDPVTCEKHVKAFTHNVLCKEQIERNHQENVLIVTHGRVINIIYHSFKSIEWTNKNKSLPNYAKINLLLPWRRKI